MLAACTAEDPDGPSDGGAGQPDGAATGDQPDQGSPGDADGEDDMVDEVVEQGPFDGLTVTRVKDGKINSWDLSMTRGGVLMLRYRMQGRWDGSAPQLDGYQRMEEARALDGAAKLAGELIIPRSNWEFAFQIVVDDDAQFVPYHGTPTAFVSSAPELRTDGDVVDPDAVPVGEPREVGEFSLSQTVVARHPRRGDQDLVEIATTTTWTSDGRGRIDGTWRALARIEVGNAYGPMLPFSREVFDRVITDTGGDMAVEDTDSSETLPIANTTEARLVSSSSGWQAAITWDEPEETLRTTAQGGGTDVFLQLRGDGIGKIYPQVWDAGDVVESGTTWTFGAEWAVMAP